MKQVFQDFKSREMLVAEMPRPALINGGVLVQNKCSLISAGTERQTVSTGKARIVAKARMRPDLVRQVIDNIKKEGISPTYRKVMSRLSTYKPLGYSSSVIVV